MNHTEETEYVDQTVADEDGARTVHRLDLKGKHFQCVSFVCEFRALF